MAAAAAVAPPFPTTAASMRRRRRSHSSARACGVVIRARGRQHPLGGRSTALMADDDGACEWPSKAEKEMEDGIRELMRSSASTSTTTSTATQPRR